MTDSLSLIERIKSCRPRTSSEVELFYALSNLSYIADVSIHHVRGHANIRINEEADRLAEIGSSAQRTSSDPSTSNTITGDAVKKIITAALDESRTNRLNKHAIASNDDGVHSWFLEVSKQLTKAKIKDKHHLYKVSQTALAQLECGSFPTHLGVAYDFTNNCCSACHSKCSWKAGAQHVMFDCEAFNEVRKQIDHENFTSPKQTAGNSSNRSSLPLHDTIVNFVNAWLTISKSMDADSDDDEETDSLFEAVQ